jgi:hypothetical protein
MARVCYHVFVLYCFYVYESCVCLWTWPLPQLVKSLVLRIPTSTGEEADCLSLLLEETMGVLERWRKDKAEYGRQLAINQTLVANMGGAGRVRVGCVRVCIILQWQVGGLVGCEMGSGSALAS